MKSVNRRTVLSATAGAIVSSGIPGTPTLSLLDDTSPDSLPRRIGREHIDEVHRAATVFKHWDNTHGGAMAREIADDKLRRLAPLLLRPCPLSLQSDLHIAFAELASVVAFMLFDAYEHNAARKRFTFALERAEIGQNWQQRAIVLARMARQEIWCGNADDGLTYAEMALVRAERLTSTERAMLHTIRARALAKLGPSRTQDALTAVGVADTAFANSRPAEDPTWMRFYDEAQHHGDTAHALFDIAMHSGLDTEASQRFKFSVEHHAPEFARSRAISRTKLASLTMAQGDPAEAAHIGSLALDDAGGVHSLRATDDFRALHRFAAPHASLSEVRRLRARIEAVVGVVA